jgi:hypothetical protein
MIKIIYKTQQNQLKTLLNKPLKTSLKKTTAFLQSNICH